MDHRDGLSPTTGPLDTLNMFFLLPTHVLSFLKMLPGALSVLYGKRMAGRFRWYHPGWPLIAAGLFGIPHIHGLQTGLLQIPSALYHLVLNPQRPEELRELRVRPLSDTNRCLLLLC